MIDFFNSIGFQTLVELLVGTVALLVYRFQKKDKLRSAATTLILEIQQAERAVVKAKECIRKGDLNENIHILQSDTWEQNKYLFTKVLDKDEWDSITEFYDKARLLDESIEHTRKYFDNDVEQIRINKQRAFANISMDTMSVILDSDKKDNDAIMRVMRNRMSLFDDLYMSQQDKMRYHPQKIFDDAKYCVEDFSNISTTSVGQKLKKIARNRWFL